VIFTFLPYLSISCFVDVSMGISATLICSIPSLLEIFNVLVLVDEDTTYLLLSKHYQKTILHTFLVSTHKDQDEVFNTRTLLDPLFLEVVPFGTYIILQFFFFLNRASINQMTYSSTIIAFMVRVIGLFSFNKMIF